MRDTRGTGILIGPRHVLTAKHVLAPVGVRVDNQDEEVPIAGARVEGFNAEYLWPNCGRMICEGR